MSTLNGQGNNLRYVIRMKREHGTSKWLKSPGRRFDDEQGLAAAIDLSLPPEDGLHTRYDIDTRREVSSDQRIPEPPCNA